MSRRPNPHKEPLRIRGSHFDTYDGQNSEVLSVELFAGFEGGEANAGVVADSNINRNKAAKTGPLIGTPYCLVPGGELEPALPFGKGISSPLCLPIHHPGKGS